MTTVVVDILLTGLAAVIVIALGKLAFVKTWQVPGLSTLFAAV